MQSFQQKKKHTTVYQNHYATFYYIGYLITRQRYLNKIFSDSLSPFVTMTPIFCCVV